MNQNRRRAIVASTALLLSAWGSPRSVFAGSFKHSTAAALDTSPLIYLSPIVSNGKESSCHAEVWFVHHDEEIFVVTWADKWKAEAMRRGFSRAKIWIGDFGPWKSANKRYLSAPSLHIEGRFENDPDIHSSLLAEFASKYKNEWSFWDKRVRDGLVTGAWVLMRYQVIS